MNRSLVVALVIIGIVTLSGYAALNSPELASRTTVTTALPSFSSSSSSLQTSSSYSVVNYTETGSSYPDSYYWSMRMMNGYVNDTWMRFPTQSIGISEAILLMKNPPPYVTSIETNDTIQFYSRNITMLALGMMPEDAANLTGMSPPSYSTDDVFVIYGLINPTLVFPDGAYVRVIFVNLDDEMYHNLVFTSTSPPYSYTAMMTNGGGMMGGSNSNSFLSMMPLISPAKYDQGIASAYYYSFNISNQISLWYICNYPGHAQSGMYGKALITG